MHCFRQLVLCGVEKIYSFLWDDLVSYLGLGDRDRAESGCDLHIDLVSKLTGIITEPRHEFAWCWRSWRRYEHVASCTPWRWYTSAWGSVQAVTPPKD